jgi:hypothetical protein
MGRAGQTTPKIFVTLRVQLRRAQRLSTRARQCASVSRGEFEDVWSLSLGLRFRNAAFTMSFALRSTKAENAAASVHKQTDS